MPVIKKGRRLFIVSTQTLLAWKRFQRQAHEDDEPARILNQDSRGAFIVQLLDSKWRLLDKQEPEEVG